MQADEGDSMSEQQHRAPAPAGAEADRTRIGPEPPAACAHADSKEAAAPRARYVCGTRALRQRWLVHDGESPRNPNPSAPSAQLGEPAPQRWGRCAAFDRAKRVCPNARKRHRTGPVS